MVSNYNKHSKYILLKCVRFGSKHTEINVPLKRVRRSYGKLIANKDNVLLLLTYFINTE